MAFRHEALLYRGAGEYADGVGSFIREGLDAGEPVMVAVPPQNIAILREQLGPAAERVRFEDMTDFGINPWRIIPGVRKWVDEQAAAARVRFVGEPIWPGRSDEAAEEATRHEALINLAFADSPAAILCPYDADRLDDDILADAECTHPVIVRDGHDFPSPRYNGIELALHDHELPDPPPEAVTLPVTEDLASLRRWMRDLAHGTGLEGERVDDLLLAASEAATNALLHGPGTGTVTIWAESGRLLCDVRSPGSIVDPLAGRRHPPPGATSGRGIWLINQVCELVQLRLGPPEAVLRLHLASR